MTVSARAGPPATVDVGVMLVRVGGTLLIVKLASAEVPPPGVGLSTVTLAVPAVSMSLAAICAVS